MTNKIKLVTNSISEKHEIRLIVRSHENIYLCDHCNREVKEVDINKISKGKDRNYAYCPECMKELYPNYKKVSFYNPNPVMNNIMIEALARKEYRK